MLAAFFNMALVYRLVYACRRLYFDRRGMYIALWDYFTLENFNRSNQE